MHSQLNSPSLKQICHLGIPLKAHDNQGPCLENLKKTLVIIGLHLWSKLHIYYTLKWMGQQRFTSPMSWAKVYHKMKKPLTFSSYKTKCIDCQGLQERRCDASIKSTTSLNLGFQRSGCSPQGWWLSGIASPFLQGAQ